MSQISKSNPLSHYHWGNGCDAWNLVDEHSLAIKLERMPAGATEAIHVHAKARQFFFILTGQATVEVEGKPFLVNPLEGMHIRPGERHSIANNAQDPIEFILCSEPSTLNDRYNQE